MKVITMLAVAVLVGSIAWLAYQPGWEPAIAILTATIALVGLNKAGANEKSRRSQEQNIGSRGIGIQAGGDVSIDRIESNDNSRK